MKQFICNSCDSQFDETITISVSYREYYGASLQHDHNEACPECHSLNYEETSQNETEEVS